MNIFWHILTLLLPLYFILALAFIGGRYLNFCKRTIADIQIYLLVPFIALVGIPLRPLNWDDLLIPVTLFLVCFIVGRSGLWVGKKLLKDNRANLMAAAVSNANAGSFGTSIALLIFTPEQVSKYLLGWLALNMFMFTGTYYLAARGKFSIQDSVRKLFRMPATYASFIGIGLGLAAFQIPDIALNTFDIFKGAFIFCGMAIQGASLGHVKSFKVDWSFLGLSFLFKFAIWPLLIFGLIYLDQSLFHFWDVAIYKTFVLISIVPLPNMSVAFAASLKLHEDKMAFTVFLSNLFAMLYVPIIYVLYLQ